MSKPKPPSPTRTRRKDEEFNWPPTDEELAQYLYVDGPAETISMGDFESEHATVDPGVLEQQPTETVGFSTTLERSARTAAVSAEQTEVPGTSDLLVATFKPALDGTRRDDWVTNMRQLQSLIEALTEKVEWRISNATRR